jgi:hypothetical protein
MIQRAISAAGLLGVDHQRAQLAVFFFLEVRR